MFSNVKSADILYEVGNSFLRRWTNTKPTLNVGIVYWDMLSVKIHPSSPSSSLSPSPFLFLSHSLFLSPHPLPLHHLPTNLDWRHVILMIIPRVLTTWISWLDNAKGHFFLQCGLTVWRGIKTHQYSLWNRFYSLIIQGHSRRSWGGHWWMRGSVFLGQHYHTGLQCKAKRQYLLTLRLSRYCFSALRSSVIPASKRQSPIVRSMLGQRRRRWTNFDLTLLKLCLGPFSGWVFKPVTTPTRRLSPTKPP